jgi:hypothetical protein
MEARTDLYSLVEDHAYLLKCTMRRKELPPKEKVKDLIHRSQNFQQCLESLRVELEVRDSNGVHRQDQGP